MAYTATGIYNDKALTEDDRAKVNALKQQYDAAKANGGSAETLNALHNQAENIRAGYGYNGGADGSEYRATITPLNKTALPSATSQESYINKYSDAALAASTQALKAAYDKNRSTLDASAAKIPETYQTARNQTSATNEQNKANFNEYAAGSGLNTGAGSQAQLAMSNQYMGNISSINNSEANAQKDIERQRTDLAMEYENSIAQAVADGNTQRAQALYDEAVRVDNSLVSTAANQAALDAQAQQAQYASLESAAKTKAAYGDFSGYLALGYTQDSINQMYATWAKNNPLLAQTVVSDPTKKKNAPLFGGKTQWSDNGAVNGFLAMMDARNR